MAEFEKLVKARKIKIAVVGLGYVGLPLALEFAKKGFSVTGIEVDRDRLAHIRKKESYITDVRADELKQALGAGRFSATCEFSALADIDVVIICVPTPLKRKYHPNIAYIKQAVQSISRHLKNGSLVVLESTTYPGTTEEVILPILERGGLKHNRDFFLSFSPERIDPGNKAFPVHKIPKVVGGLSREATELTKLVYSEVIDKVVPVSCCRSAEAVKLLENTFRLVNIALIDELAQMLHKMNIDIWEVVEAAATKPFGFMPFYPGPGVGGHCIPKDPLYLYWKAKRFGFRSRFIKLASDVVNFMPEYVSLRVAELLRGRGIAMHGARILVIGATYKKDIKDLRKSPSLDLIGILQKKGAKVSYYDPLVPYLKLNHVINLRSVELKKEILKASDCAVIATDHSGVDYDFLLRNSKLVFDTRNVYKGVNDRKAALL